MHICTKSIQIYFSIFFDFILVLLSFHCSHTIPTFSDFFPYFCCCSIHLQKPVISTWHSYLLPFRCLHSHMSCGIKLCNMLHSLFRCQLPAHQTESKPRAGYEIIGMGYMWAQTCTCSFLLTELTITEEVRAYINYLFDF